MNSLPLLLRGSCRSPSLLRHGTPSLAFNKKPELDGRRQEEWREALSLRGRGAHTPSGHPLRSPTDSLLGWSRSHRPQGWRGSWTPSLHISLCPPFSSDKCFFPQLSYATLEGLREAPSLRHGRSGYLLLTTQHYVPPLHTLHILRTTTTHSLSLTVLYITLARAPFTIAP